MKNEMTWAQQLTRKRPKLMRRWRDDKNGICRIEVANDLKKPAFVAVQLQFGDGHVEDVRLPMGQ
jgi:hypothetical protein